MERRASAFTSLHEPQRSTRVNMVPALWIVTLKDTGFKHSLSSPDPTRNAYMAYMVVPSLRYRCLSAMHRVGVTIVLLES